MDALDRAIVEMIQTDFPICVSPYAEIGRRVGSDESEVIRRLGALKERQIIRRIGALFDPRKLGYVSTLVAARVSPDLLEETTDAINEYNGVTHNYLRDASYNVWFTLIAKGDSARAKILARIAKLPGVLVLHSLPAERFYKLKVDFKTLESADDAS
ncbi:MAG: AsnC family transcriptional regulator [Candidatus Alcyoniella australis]|nr:AsnC family transcriptional regulator [Candidatus Alcyoniella australis]